MIGEHDLNISIEGENRSGLRGDQSFNALNKLYFFAISIGTNSSKNNSYKRNNH